MHGDIALEDYEVQGLFINLCSYYWSNECDLTFRKAEKKFKDAPVDLWQTLLESNIIKKIDSYLVITFLDEQQNERQQTSKRNSRSGKISAEKRRLAKLEQESNEDSTSVEITLNENPTNKRREEERREDNIKQEINFDKFLDWFNERRTKYIEKPSNIKRLTHQEKTTLALLKTSYSSEDFEFAMYNFCNDQWANENKQVLCSYFLQIKTFNKFLSTEKTTMLTKDQRRRQGWKV